MVMIQTSSEDVEQVTKTWPTIMRSIYQTETVIYVFDQSADQAVMTVPLVQIIG